MSALSLSSGQVRAVEAIMLHHFQCEPFHNLKLIYNTQLLSDLSGGTCSDKTLSFVAAASKAGFDVALHTGFIGGQEIHRLARVRIGSDLYFADVGNGWPSLRLYPSDRNISFSCFGMNFRTEVANGRVSVFHERLGRESLQLEIDVKSRSESDIRADIEARFTSGVEYPFSRSLRFSLIVRERFLFLRGDRLEIYSDNSFELLEQIGEPEVPNVLHKYFGFDIRLAPPKDQRPSK